MVAAATVPIADAVRRAALPLTDEAASLDPLMEVIGDARFALIGEASHGTHEFYDVRARLTRRLIEEKGFDAVAVEADWPDAYRVNRYVRGRSAGDALPEDALGDFQRFPLWMWRNTVVLDFIAWLRTHNREREYRDRVGFYGVDLYSLYGSIQAVIRYLEGVDPDAARRARERYACFEHYDDPQRYGYALSRGWAPGCEDQVVAQLVELRAAMRDYLQRDGLVAEDEAFFAQQNALLVRNAERYYREMFSGRVNTWNLRDTHMADTVDALAEHLARQGRAAKVVVWAHNSHLGDARATSMRDIGELNLGQLMRERHGDAGQTRIVGFTTYDGEVTAADDWDEPARRKRVRPGLPGSVEALFHETGLERFILDLRGDANVAQALREPMPERAIGVIYRPQTERASHYFDTRISDQFDAVIHIDRTTALEPLDPTSMWQAGEEETYPFGV